MANPPVAKKKGANRALRLQLIRQIHLYLGVLFAPSILFFSVTGALQLFSLHEAHGAYTPPAIVEGLASVHKDQVYRVEPRPAAGAPADDDHDHGPPGADGHAHKPPSPAVLVLKVFFLVTALGLVSSTLLGLWMALRYSRSPRTAWALLAAGALAPALLVLLGLPG